MAKEALDEDILFKELIVQRSRKYVRESQKLHKSGQEILFPEPQDPKVQEYDLTKIYGPLINKFIRAFDKKTTSKP